MNLIMMGLVDFVIEFLFCLRHTNINRRAFEKKFKSINNKSYWRDYDATSEVSLSNC